MSNFSFDTAQKVGSLREPKSIQISTKKSDRPQFFSFSLNRRSSVQGDIRRLSGTVDFTVFNSDRQKLGTLQALNNRNGLDTVLNEGEYFLKTKFSRGGDQFRINLMADRIAAPDPATALGVGLTASNQLALLDDTNLTNVTQIAITGLQSGENLLGIDFRPNTGQLFGLGSSNRLYTIDLSTGSATAVGDPFAVSLNGTSFGFDFNPTVDRIRVVSNAGQNLRLNPDTGAVVDADLNTDGIQVDGTLNGATTSIMATAYTNSFSGSTTTAQYGINADTDQLFLQNPPNAGTQTLVGDLGINVNSNVSFDIVSFDGFDVAFATSGASFFSVALSTGAATLVGKVSDQLKPVRLIGFAGRAPITTTA